MNCRDFIGKGDFIGVLGRVSDEPERARKLLVRMSARLRDVEDMLTRLCTHAARLCCAAFSCD